MALVQAKKKKRKLQVAEPVEEAAATLPVVVSNTGVEKKKKKKRKISAIDVVEPEAPLAKKRKKKKAGAPASSDAPAAVNKADSIEDLFANRPRKAKSEEVSAKAEDLTVFVDGLPYTWTVAKVEEHFSPCGQVKEVKAPTWQDSGRLRGFAHITFVNKAGRDKALAMNNTQVDTKDKKGRYLKIDPAMAPVVAKVPTAAELQGKRRLFVKNLPYDATEKQIGELFAKCGTINEVRVPTSFGRSKGFAYVEFARWEHLQAAIAMQPPASLAGRTLLLDADIGSGPKAGFHHRKEAFDSGFGPKRGTDSGFKKGEGKGKDSGFKKGDGGKGKDGGKGRGSNELSPYGDKGKGKGKGKGKDKGKGPPKKMSLF